MAGHYRKRGKDSYELVYRGFSKSIKAQSKSQAEKALAAFVTDVDRDKFKTAAKMTLNDLAKRFLRDNSELSEETKLNYESYLNTRILPALGSNKIDKIKPTHIYDFYDNLKEDGIRLDGKPGGLGPSTIKKYHNILSSMFSFAIALGELEDNPCFKVKPPKIPKRKPVSLEKDIAIDLLRALASESLKYRGITLIAACTGMRRGEILGIGDATFNLNNYTINVNRAVRHSSNAEIFLNNPKTESSNRSIPFPQSLLPLFRELIIARDEQREKCGDMWVSQIWLKDELIANDLLFTQWNGKPMHPNSIDTWFRKFKIENGFPDSLKFHGLRHTNITVLIKSGVDIGTVADNAGHATKTMTLAYDDPSAEALREVAEKIEKAFDLENTVGSLLGQPKNIRRKRFVAASE